MIYLYHGTDTEFETPVPEMGRRGTDFGQGFYLTPDMDSARAMASAVTRRQGEGIKTISVFEFDIDDLIIGSPGSANGLGFVSMAEGFGVA